MTVDQLTELHPNGAWTLGDEMALEALPIEVKELLARALLHRPGATEVPRDKKGTTLEDAYREGWDAAMCEVEVVRDPAPRHTPYSPKRTKAA